MKRSSRNQAGFTLLEIMMVVMIIALLAGAAIFAMKDQFGVAGDAKAKGDINGLKTALMMYRARNGFYPTTEQGLKALVSKPDSEPRPRNWVPSFNEMPRDAWQSEYIFEYPAKRSKDEYDLYSPGPDRKPNTPDDLGNWQKEA